MEIKKFTVHVSYHTCIDVDVYADKFATKEEILEMAGAIAAEDREEIIKEIITNCEEDGNTEIISTSDLFENKTDCYNAICECVNAAGGYLLFKETNRPIVQPAGDESEPTIKVKSLFMSNDNSSPLKFISDIDESWDADDYFIKQDLELIYATIKNLI